MVVVVVICDDGDGDDDDGGYVGGLIRLTGQSTIIVLIGIGLVCC